MSKINIYTNISYKIIRFYYIYRQIQCFLLFRVRSPIFALLLFFKNHLVQITYVVISGTVMWTIRDVKILNVTFQTISVGYLNTPNKFTEDNMQLNHKKQTCLDLIKHSNKATLIEILALCFFNMSKRTRVQYPL